MRNVLLTTLTPGNPRLYFLPHTTNTYFTHHYSSSDELYGGPQIDSTITISMALCSQTMLCCEAVIKHGRMCIYNNAHIDRSTYHHH